MRDFIIGALAPLSVLIPIFIAIRRYEMLDNAMKTVLIYLVAGGLTSAITLALSYSGLNNMPFFHLFTMIEFVLLFLFFYYALPGDRLFIIVTLVIPGFLLVCLADILLVENINSYNRNTRTLESFLVSFFSLRLFYKLLNRPDLPGNTARGIIWINSGILLYFSGSFMLFIFSRIMARDFFFYEIGWVLHGLLLMLMYVLFAKGFSQYKKPILHSRPVTDPHAG